MASSLTTSSMSILGFSLKQAPTRSSSMNSLSFASTGKGFPSLKMRHFRVSCAAKPETVEKVCGIVRKQLALSADTVVSGESTFAALGADSLDTIFQVTETEIVSPPSPRPLPLVSQIIEPETNSSSSSKSLPLVPLDQGNSGDVYESCSQPPSSIVLETRLDDVSLALPPIPFDLSPSNLINPHLSPGPSVSQEPIEPTTVELISNEAVQIQQESFIQTDIPEVEIVMGLEEEFDISVEEESAQSIATVQDAADLIDKLLEKKN